MRPAIAPLLLALAIAAPLGLVSCGGTRTVTISGAGDAKRLDPQVLRRTVDAFGERIVTRTSILAESVDRQIADPDMRRRTLLWRLRAAKAAFSAEHNPNPMVALIGLWYLTSATARQYGSPKMAEELGPMAERVVAMANELREEADALAARAVPPDVHARLRADIASSVEGRDLFAVDSVETSALMDQLLSVTRLEKLLAIPLAPFDLFTGVGDSGKALNELAVTANRAVDLAESYPQVLQWRMGLLLLDIERLGPVQQAQKDLTRLTDAAERLPEDLRIQVQTLLDESGPAQAEAQRTLQEVTAAGASITDMMQATELAIAELDRFIAGLKKPADPSQPPSPPGEPFRITDYAETATAITGTLQELRAAIADLQQPALVAKAQAATEAAVTRAQGAADATVDRIAWRAVQVIGVAFLAGLALLLVARWKRG